MLSPLIYRLADSRCSGQSKQRGSWREGGLPAPACHYVAPRCTEKHNHAAACLGMQKLFSWAVSARAQGHTSANVVLFSRCQQERKLKDAWLVFGALWEMSLTSPPGPDLSPTLCFSIDLHIRYKDARQGSLDQKQTYHSWLFSS